VGVRRRERSDCSGHLARPDLRPGAGCDAEAHNDLICAAAQPPEPDPQRERNGDDGRVHVLGRWSHSVSTRGSWGPCMPDQLRGADRRQRDVHHGDELGCPKRAQRSRRFEPGIVVCHPGGGSRVWDGSRWGGASFPFKNTRLSGSHLCPSWYRSPVRPSSSPRFSSQVGRSLRLCLAASVMGLACPGRWRVAGFAMGFSPWRASGAPCRS
jgi:hypothetical protein